MLGTETGRGLGEVVAESEERIEHPVSRMVDSKLRDIEVSLCKTYQIFSYFRYGKDTRCGYQKVVFLWTKLIARSLF
jgi:hypothetical protein